jgi:hypothetical protein
MTARVEIICTDDNQHPRSLIGIFTGMNGSPWQCANEQSAQGMTSEDFTNARKGVFTHADAKSWTFKCGSCRKYVRISFADARSAMSNLADLGVGTLDVSMLIRVLSGRRGKRRKAR